MSTIMGNSNEYSGESAPGIDETEPLYLYLDQENEIRVGTAEDVLKQSTAGGCWAYRLDANESEN